jgi:hypothetical protein
MKPRYRGIKRKKMKMVENIVFALFLHLPETKKIKNDRNNLKTNLNRINIEFGMEHNNKNRSE